MTIANTKMQLLNVLSDSDNKVIALTGKWGTGKTHLWNDIKEDSNEAYMQKALYVSLFGLSSIDQVKRKLIDQEIQLSTSATEAFEIASTIQSSKYSEPLERACIACSLTNIRIVKKIIKITNDVLESRTLDDATLARVVPSIVLFSAIHYRGLDDGPDMQFALNVARARVESTFNTDKAAQNEDQAKKSRWLSFIQGLGIYGCDEFEQHLVEYLESGLLDKTRIASILDRYESETERMRAKSAVLDFEMKFYWDPRTSDAQLVHEATALTDNATYLNPYDITELHAVLEKLPGARGLGEQMIDAWIEANPGKIAAAANDDNPFNKPIHPKIQDEMNAAKQDIQRSTTLVDACMHIIDNSGWSALQENVLRNATKKDFENAIRDIDDVDRFARFMTRMVQMCQQSRDYQCFGTATERFMEACREIVNDPDSPRLAGIVRRVCGEALQIVSAEIE